MRPAEPADFERVGYGDQSASSRGTVVELSVPTDTS
jgi:hypothetical protein